MKRDVMNDLPPLVIIIPIILASGLLAFRSYKHSGLFGACIYIFIGIVFIAYFDNPVRWNEVMESISQNLKKVSS